MNASSDLFDAIQAAFEAQGYRVESISFSSTPETWTVETGTRPNLLIFIADSNLLFRNAAGATVRVNH